MPLSIHHAKLIAAVRIALWSRIDRITGGCGITVLYCVQGMDACEDRAAATRQSELNGNGAVRFERAHRIGEVSAARVCTGDGREKSSE